MKRVVVTGMGIVSSIGNNTQEVVASLREAKSGIVRADKYAELGFRCQVHGAPTLDPSEAVDRRAMRFLGGGAAWNHVAMEQAIRDSGLDGQRSLPRAHRHHHGLRRAVDAHHRRERRHHPQQGPQARRTVRGAQGDVVDRVGDAGDLVQDQGRELFDLVGVRDLEPLHRQCLRDHPGRQAGHDLRRRLRGARLDALGAVRRHGRDVVELQPDARQGLARLRRRPRRFCHCRRRRRAGAGRARTRQGARRQDLCRGRRLRRDLRRRRHGGAVRRRRDALHEDGARVGRRRRSTTSIRTPPRRRSATSRRSRRSARFSAQSARRSRRPNRSPGIRSAPPACKRRSIRC